MSDPKPPAAATPAGAPSAVPAPSTAAVQAISDELKARFSLPDTALKVQRATRLWVEVDQAGFGPVFDHLVKGMGFGILCTITGLDLGADLGLIYHLARDCDKSAAYVGDKSAGYVGDKSAAYIGGIMANVKTRVPKGQATRSVTPYFPGAAIYEREVEDLLGARFEGRPEMPRYPLPEDWPQDEHPLLKDWKPREAAAPSAPAAPAPASSSPASTEGAAKNV